VQGGLASLMEGGGGDVVLLAGFLHGCAVPDGAQDHLELVAGGDGPGGAGPA